MSSRYYCSPITPTVKTRVPVRGQKHPTYAAFFWTYTFASLDWLYDAFYCNGIKRVPFELMPLLLTPLRTIWYLRVSTYSNRDPPPAILVLLLIWVNE